MARKKASITLPTVDELFTSQEEREDAASERVREIALGDIDPFPSHPFQVRENAELAQLVESIAENGILMPLAVRPKGGGRFELVSGHRRKRAAEMAGLASAPCVVRDMTDDEAVIAMVDSNLQRETILPSERAFAYSMRLEAMKRQGRRTDLTSVQLEQKLDGRWSRSILAEELGMSEAKVQRFIRLTFLIPELLALVDENRMKMLPAVEVSHLSHDEQEHLLDAIEAQAATPSHAQAVKMKRYSKEGSLTVALIRSIMEEEKPNQAEQVRIPKRRIARFFEPGATAADIEGRIVRALELLEQAERRRARQGGA